MFCDHDPFFFPLFRNLSQLGFKKFQAVPGSRFDSGYESNFVVPKPVLQDVEQRQVGFDRRTLGNQSFEFSDLGDAGEAFVFEFATSESQLFIQSIEATRRG